MLGHFVGTNEQPWIDAFTAVDETRLDAYTPTGSPEMGPSSIVSETGTISGNAARHTETLGAALGGNMNFDAGDTVWNKNIGWTIADQGAGDYEGVATNATLGYLIYQNVTTGVTTNEFYRLDMTCSNFTGGGVSVRAHDGVAEIVGPQLTGVGSTFMYFKAKAGTVTIAAKITIDASDLKVDDFVFKQVTLSSILSLSNLGFSQGRWWFTPAATAGELAGIVVLANDSVASTDGLWCYYDDTVKKLQVFKRVAGTDTSLISTAVTYSAGAKACLVYDKTQGKIWAFYNNAIVGTAQALTDASIINNTWHGTMSTGDASVDAVDFAPLGYGADLFDPGAGTFESGTYSWTVNGTNTIANDSNQLKVTYVDHSNGAWLLFNDAKDLTTDLTIGALYKWTEQARVSAGNSVNTAIYNGDAWQVVQTVTSTSLVGAISYFIASAGNAQTRQDGMGAGEIIWLDNLALRKVN